MAYNELIKNFDRIRAYMRDFYVYGFKSRDEFDQKSARSYDDERRRIESWLGDYMGFRQTPDGKNVFISIDSRVSHHNPLYKAWKAKSFTDGDITLHFAIFDILSSPEIKKTIGQITEEIDSKYLSMNTSMPRISSIPLRTSKSSSLLGTESKTTSLCALSTGDLPKTFFFLFQTVKYD